MGSRTTEIIGEEQSLQGKYVLKRNPWVPTLQTSRRKEQFRYFYATNQSTSFYLQVTKATGQLPIRG